MISRSSIRLLLVVRDRDVNDVATNSHSEHTDTGSEIKRYSEIIKSLFYHYKGIELQNVRCNTEGTLLRPEAEVVIQAVLERGSSESLEDWYRVELHARSGRHLLSDSHWRSATTKCEAGRSNG